MWKCVAERSPEGPLVPFLGQAQTNPDVGIPKKEGKKKMISFPVFSNKFKEFYPPSEGNAVYCQHHTPCVFMCSNTLCSIRQS